MSKKKPEAPEPMALIMGRADAILGGPPYRAPSFNAAALDRLEHAARDYARWHNSDPFAYQRIRRDMLAGWELVSDIANEARMGLSRREAVKREER